MPAMRRKQYPFARNEFPVIALTLDAQPRRARCQEHPFVTILVAPFSIRRRLTGRDDALDAKMRELQEHIDKFVRDGASRQIHVEVSRPGGRHGNLIQAW